MTLSYAQEIKQVSQISVTGRESKSYSRSGHYRHGTNKGIMLRKKKKENDQHIEAVLKIIKK
jgi:hypothetical protein